MDRSFLFNDDVIKASRNFVCIRLATYEDAEEAEFLRKVYSNRQGDLENTVFTMLGPDGKLPLTDSGRGPHFAFRNASAMADYMDELSFQFPGKPNSELNRLPEMKDMRLAINVSSCDGLPLIVAYGKEPADASAVEKKLVQLAFSKSLAGKFHYYSTSNPEELTLIDGWKNGQTGIAVVTPDEYGLKAKLKKAWSIHMNTSQIESALSAVANSTRRMSKSHNQHVRKGMQKSIEWETEIPVEDKMALRAQQNRQKRNRK